MMRNRIAWLVFAVVIACGIVAVPALFVNANSDDEAAPIYGVKIPAGYREWTMISMARVGEPLNDLRVKLGNDLAVKAFRDATAFPDGAIIARLAYNAVTSEENNKVFRFAAEKQGLPPDKIDKLLAGSFVAGTPQNV